MKRKLLSAALAALVALAIPGAAFAAEDSHGSTESLSVLATISLTGIPATFVYPDTTPGAGTMAPSFTFSATTTAPSGMHVDVAASDLTHNSNSIPSTARTFAVSAASGGSAAAGGAYPGPAGSRFVLATSSAAGTIGATVQPKVVPPANTVPDNYTGSLTWYATTNP